MKILNTLLISLNNIKIKYFFLTVSSKTFLNFLYFLQKNLILQKKFYIFTSVEKKFLTNFQDIQTQKKILTFKFYILFVKF